MFIAASVYTTPPQRGAMFIANNPRRFALRQECHVRADMTEMSSAAARASIQHCTPDGVRDCCWSVAINIALLTECETAAGPWL